MGKTWDRTNTCNPLCRYRTTCRIWSKKDVKLPSNSWTIGHRRNLNLQSWWSHFKEWTTWETTSQLHLTIILKNCKTSKPRRSVLYKRMSKSFNKRVGLLAHNRSRVIDCIFKSSIWMIKVGSTPTQRTAQKWSQPVSKSAATKVKAKI